MPNVPFDLSSVLAQAAQVTASAQEDSGGGMKLIYPQQGTLKVRLLYNNAAGVVMRKFERHTINKQKITCLQNYGVECPVCKMIENIQNATGADLWQLKRTTRGIAYAEYIDSDYKWDNPNDAPKKGEIVILMFPWTIYTDLNRLITQAGQNIYSLIASNVGGVFKISRWTESKQTKYRAEIDPFDNAHQTCPSEEEYQKLLMDLPSLNEKFVPIELTDNLTKAAQSTAEELNKEYLSPHVQQPNLGQAGMNLSQMAGAFMAGANTPSQPIAPPTPPTPPQIPQSYIDPNTGIRYELVNGNWVPATPATPAAPQTPPAPSTPQMPPQFQPPAQQFQNPGMYPGAQVTPMSQMASVPHSAQAPATSNNPPCYGKHGTAEVNPNSCLLCPSEGQCKSASGR